MEKQEIVLGPPGTGKTTHLLSKVEEALVSGTPGYAIGYFAFTKKAAEEAVTRAVKKFGLGYRDLPYFRTLHSLAFQQLGLGIGQIMSKEHFQELGHHLGMQLTAFISMEEGSAIGQSKDDRLVFLENLARVKCIPLREAWLDQKDDISWVELERYAAGLQEFKRVRGLTDYTDMLRLFVERNKAPRLDLLVIDEAQDLSELQWRMVDLLTQHADRVLIAGDDDQCIYRWAGASVERFMGLPGKVTVLDQSYRIPADVHYIAMEISKRIVRRREKVFRPRASDGAVKYYPELEHVDMSKGQWLVLARNKYLLGDVQNLCETNGYNFMASGMRAVEPDLVQAIKIWQAWTSSSRPLTNEECQLAEKYMHKRNISNVDLTWDQAFSKVAPARVARIKAMLDRGEDIAAEPRIKLSTIHGAKGGEADNVLLITDVSYKAYQEMQRNPDDELRVLYVAVTRAKVALHVLEPQSDMHFKF